MTIFIAADHRGFEMKNQLMEYLQAKNIRIEDMGNYEYKPEDDFPDFAKKVAQAVLQKEESLGVVVCGSGVGVSIAVNRFKGIRCGIAFEENQVKHIKENDHINVLALASDHVNLEKAKKLVDIFIAAQPKQQEKYLRRIKKLDNIN